MFLLSNQASAPCGGVAGTLAMDISQLQLTLDRAQSSGQHIAARMIGLDLLGLVNQLVTLVGQEEAVALVGSLEQKKGAAMPSTASLLL